MLTPLQVPTTDQIEVNFENALETINRMANGSIALLPNVIIALIVFVIFYLFARGARASMHRVTRNRSQNVGLVLGRLAQAGVLLVGFLVALAIVAPSVKPVDILGTLGIGGVAIGFAFRDILQNLLAGILILWQEPFKAGDQIIFKDYEGTVEEVQTRATVLRTYDGRRVLIPNGEIYINSMVINTAYEARRSEYDVGIGYGDDIHRAIEVMLNAIRSVSGVLTDPAPDVLTVELAGSSVNLRARWWTHTHWAEVMRVKHEVITAMKYSLNDAAIDLPYPTQVVLWHDQTEETDGDRSRQREGWPAGDQPPRSKTLASSLDAITSYQGERQGERQGRRQSGEQSGHSNGDKASR